MGRVGRRAAAVIVFVFALAATSARAQTVAEPTPQKGDTEFQVWTGGGHSFANGIGNTGGWNVGVRYGWVLTDAVGPRFLRGRFECVVDAVPAYVIFQPRGAVYGAGINPLGLKWNFDTGRRVAPYFDMDGGLLLTSNNVPAGISRVNFASGPGFGANFGHGKAHWSLEVRWLHISDAGLTPDNPGINILQARVGLGWFHHKE